MCLPYMCVGGVRLGVWGVVLFVCVGVGGVVLCRCVCVTCGYFYICFAHHQGHPACGCLLHSQLGRAAAAGGGPLLRPRADRRLAADSNRAAQHWKGDICIDMCICIDICMCVCIYVYTYIYIYVYTHRRLATNPVRTSQRWQGDI